MPILVALTGAAYQALVHLGQTAGGRIARFPAERYTSPRLTRRLVPRSRPLMPSTVLRVTNERTGLVLGASIREARSFAARVQGLLGSAGLGDGEGLWIEPCSSIHMFFMRFPIDAVFVDRERRVTRLLAGLAPWQVARGGTGARAVLELGIGAIDRSSTRIGDTLELDG
jgi:uncharacterized membrane protein (UPF0127 family)